jgi:hypothetical protein
MDMYKVFRALRFVNTVNHIRNEKNKAVATFSEVSHHIETAHEAREVITRIVEKEVGREDLQYVIRAGKRYGPGVANRIYARYMRQRAIEQSLEEEADESETSQD